MIVSQSGWWVLEQMLRQATSALGPNLKARVSREQIECAWIPDGLKVALISYPGAATAIDDASYYQVLRVSCEEPRLIRDARTAKGTRLRLVAVAENAQVVDSDPTIFVPVDEDNRVTDPAECYGCRFENDYWRALDQEYTFDAILPWRWARPFTQLAYESSEEVITLAWDSSAEQLGALLEEALGLRPGPLFQVDDMVGRIDEVAAWIASRRPSGTYRLCLAGAHRIVRRVGQALDDARARGKTIKPR